MKKIILSSLFVMGVLMALTQTASAVPVPDVPDAGSSAMLLGAAIGGIAMVRKFWR